ncbi:MAG: protein kinase [Kofleriaceae bacterium]
MTMFTRDELALYVMGEHDDPAAVEAALETDHDLRAMVADEARFEELLRDAAASAAFCPGCGEVVPGARCDGCGVAIAPGGYVVERVLVTSPHGRMYVARDVDGAQVALKELAFVHAPTLSTIAAFERETKFLRALDHPSIPRFVASFEEGAGVHIRYYLAQELVTGRSLEASLAEHFYSESEIVAIARQVLDVLVYLQSLSPIVIHRDIKPANLLARADSSIAVVDFGAAHVQGTTAGSSSTGTFGYMPIEQLAGLVDTTTDPYALGASLLHLLTRREPWRILQDTPLTTMNISRGLRGFLGKLAASDPADRFPTARAARDALERIEQGLPMTVAERPAWKTPTLVAAGAAAVIAAGFGGIAMFRSEAPVDLLERDFAAIAAHNEQLCGCPLGDRECGQRVIDGFRDVHRNRRIRDADPAQTYRAEQLGKRTLECLDRVMSPPAQLQLAMPPGVVGTLWLDGQQVGIGPVADAHELKVPAGEHRIEVRTASGRWCAQELTVAPGDKRTVDCTPASPFNQPLPFPPGPPHRLPQTALEPSRKTGSKSITPDAATRAAIQATGKRALGATELCVDDTGKVTKVGRLQSTGFPAFDRQIEIAIAGWRFGPVEINGRPTPVCTYYFFSHPPYPPYPPKAP